MEIKNNKTIGQIGENIACEYLVKRGWKMIARNYRRKLDEIDIIAISDNKTLVFCEVKALLIKEAQKAEDFAPEDNLSTAKLRKIARACEFFARQHPELINEEGGWRIDLLAVDIGLNSKASGIRHYENI